MTRVILQAFVEFSQHLAFFFCAGKPSGMLYYVNACHSATLFYQTRMRL